MGVLIQIEIDVHFALSHTFPPLSIVRFEEYEGAWYASLISGVTKALSVIIMIGSTIGMFLDAYANPNKRKRIS